MMSAQLGILFAYVAHHAGACVLAMCAWLQATRRALLTLELLSHIGAGAQLQIVGPMLLHPWLSLFS